MVTDLTIILPVIDQRNTPHGIWEEPVIQDLLVVLEFFNCLCKVYSENQVYSFLVVTKEIPTNHEVALAAKLEGWTMCNIPLVYGNNCCANRWMIQSIIFDTSQARLIYQGPSKN